MFKILLTISLILINYFIRMKREKASGRKCSWIQRRIMDQSMNYYPRVIRRWFGR